MSNFTTSLLLSPAGHQWRTTRTLIYEIGKLGSGMIVAVPNGFLTDLGSVPRFLWWFLPPHDPKCAAAFVMHDFLYSCKEINRFVADAIFWEAMGVLGVPRWRALILYYGLRLAALVR